VPYSPGSFLYNPDSSLDFKDMLIATRQVDSWSAGHGLYQSLYRRKFTIGMYILDSETTMEIKLVNLLEGFEDGIGLSVGQVVHRSETHLPAVC
jgi:hypothetical protein